MTIQTQRSVFNSNPAILIGLFTFLYSSLLAVETPRKNEPSPGQLIIATSKIQKLYEKEYSQKKPENRIKLANKLLQDLKTEKDSALRFSLKSEAAILLSQVGQPIRSLSIYKTLEDEFLLENPTSIQLKILNSLPKGKLKGLNALVVSETWDSIHLSLLTQNRLQEALDAIIKAKNVCRTIRSKALQKSLLTKINKVKDATTEFSKLEFIIDKSLTELTEEQCERIGIYSFAYNYNWDKAIPYLKKSKNFSSLVKQEQSPNKSANDKLQLAAKWVQESNKVAKKLRYPFYQRAIHIYETLIPTISGIDLELAKKELKNIREKSQPLFKHLELEDLQVQCWLKGKWNSYPRSKMSYSYKNGYHIFQNTTRIHSHAVLAVKETLEKNFIAKFKIRGGSQVGLRSNRGKDQSLSINCPPNTVWQQVTIRRVGNELGFWVDGKWKGWKSYHAKTNMPCIPMVDILSNKYCDVEFIKILNLSK